VDWIQEGPVVNCYEQSNEPSDSIKSGYVIYCWFMKKDFAVWL